MNELAKQIEELLDLYNGIKETIRQDPKLSGIYEQWKAGGYLVDSNIISMYPNIEGVLEVVNTIPDEDSEDDLDNEDHSDAE